VSISNTFLACLYPLPGEIHTYVPRGSSHRNSSRSWERQSRVQTILVQPRFTYLPSNVQGHPRCRLPDRRVSLEWYCLYKGRHPAPVSQTTNKCPAIVKTTTLLRAGKGIMSRQQSHTLLRVYHIDGMAWHGMAASVSRPKGGRSLPLGHKNTAQDKPSRNKHVEQLLPKLVNTQ
jgi:hypothetical protein